MSLVTKGRPTGELNLQPGSELVFERDGSVRGRRVLEGDAGFWEQSAFQIGAPFPGYPSVEVYTSSVTMLPLGRARVTLDYIGLSADPTPYQIEFLGNVSEEPIETHPSFSSLAGTAESPQAGAMFDEESGEFIGFNPEAGSELAGVTGYLCPSITIRRTYWTYRTPRPVALGSIAGYFGDIILPAGTGNFLSSGFSYRQVGRAFQVTEEYMGSGRRGWSNRIYN